jgi:hypothetical protein
MAFSLVQVFVREKPTPDTSQVTHEGPVGAEETSSQGEQGFHHQRDMTFHNTLFLSAIAQNEFTYDTQKVCTMTEGYIYVMSNSMMAADTFKVGFTDKTPTERLAQANSSTWALPNFKIEFAKKVVDARDKEQKLHKALSLFGKRVDPKREFFVVPLKNIRTLFDMFDGEMWSESNHYSPPLQPTDEKRSDIIQSFSKKAVEHIDLTTGQRIRHVLKSNGDTWIGTYESDGGITCNDTKYTSLSAFALAHNRTVNPTRQTTDGWGECEAFVDLMWVPTKKT